MLGRDRSRYGLSLIQGEQYHALANRSKMSQYKHYFFHGLQVDNTSRNTREREPRRLDAPRVVRRKSKQREWRGQQQKKWHASRIYLCRYATYQTKKSANKCNKSLSVLYSRQALSRPVRSVGPLFSLQVFSLQSMVKPVSSKQMQRPRHSSSSFFVSYMGRSSLLKHVWALGKALSLFVMDCTENDLKLPSLLCSRERKKKRKKKWKNGKTPKKLTRQLHTHARTTVSSRVSVLAETDCRAA